MDHLFDRVKKGDLDYIKTVTAVVLLDARDKYGNSVLHIATQNDKFDCCKEILKKCPSLLYYQESFSKYTLLHQATSNYNYKLIQYFLSMGLEAATKEENMQRFKKWIKLKNYNKDTVLTQATYRCNLRIMKRLIELDREHKLGLSEIVGRNGKTALQWAVIYDNHEMIKLLTDKGDPSIATTQPQEALHTAGKDATNDFYGGEFDKNSSTDSITRLLSDLASEKPQPYSHAQLMKFTKDFSDPVGSGGFGDVYKGEFPNGVAIAVKVLKSSRPKSMEKQFAAEVSTMGRTYHRNLIKLYGYCYEADMKALIYEYMEKGALDVILKKNNLDMVKLYTIATEIARGISYLHESCYPQIIHHDLKPANVLLDSEYSPRIIDFGLAKLNMEKSQFAQTGLRGTRGYVAPEIILYELGMISYKCDVFSFGMILFDILKCKINYVSQRWLPGQVWEKFKENQLDNFFKDHGIKEDDKANAKTISMVALLCAEYNPQNRPSMSTVVKMLEGEMTPRQPVNPFPHYDSSSESNSNNTSTYDSRN